MTTMPRIMDLKIENAALANTSEQQTIAIQDGLIVEIAPALSGPSVQTLDAAGRLIIPGLIDPHLHLDKAFLLDKTPATIGTFEEALEKTLRLKEDFTVEDIQARARRAIDNAIAFGTTAIRSHVEVDPILQLTSIKALLPIKNLFTPFGDGDPLKICTLLAQTLQLGTQDRHRLCLSMATTQAARAIGIDNHRVAVGCPADLVILDAASVSQAVGAPSPNRTTVKAGRVVSQTAIERRLAT